LDKYVINGGARLRGSVTIDGAKNAVVAILPATVLVGGRCVIENVPNISDVTVLTTTLRELGAKVDFIDSGVLEIDTTNISSCTVPYELARSLRASYYFIGALMGRTGQASVSMPGGCHFGVRPIDQHIKGFEALGGDVSISSGMINVQVPGGPRGAHIRFDVVSVGATVNVMLAAVKAQGVTVMENVAKEPHIVDLANFLNACGADIRGAGTDVIKIHGVDMLRGVDYSIIPDQIEAGTYMVLAAATCGDILVKNVIPKHLESITDKLREVGAKVEEYDDSVRVIGSPVIEKINLKTMPHPGFPTDMQPQMGAMLCRAAGTSVVTEGVWDGRFRYMDELKRMGANVTVDGKIAIIEGVSTLTGAPVKATDLRAGMALVIAGLMAEGVTEIEDVEHVERGYSCLVQKIRALGGDIEKQTIPDGTRIGTAL
jgi:UDP-N-acetylglucosamine 1-carboxyvinyltransferase